MLEYRVEVKREDEARRSDVAQGLCLSGVGLKHQSLEAGAGAGVG